MPATAKKIFVAQLIAGQPFQDVFLVSRKLLAETKAGKPYLALGLMDRTGEIEARVWDNAREYDALAEEGGFVLVQAVAKPFRDQMQLGVTAMQRVPETAVDLGDFMPASTRPLAEMAAELDAVIEGVGDPSLRGLLQAIFQGETLALFQRAPAAKKLHHAYIGGLIEHTLSIVGMAEKAASHYPLIDRDMLVAGALVHDLAKIEEFDFARPPFGYTNRGRLVGHLALGAEMVRKAAEQTEGVSAEQVDLLMHIVLSHHGQHAYGAPVLPMTPEAILLHHLDDMDAKMNYMDGLRTRMSGEGWQWSEYQRHLERYLYLRAAGGSEEPPAAEDEPEPFPPAPTRGRGASVAQAGRGQAPGGKRQQTLF
jgi:3'-5' exoribonuclease